MPHQTAPLRSAARHSALLLAALALPALAQTFLFLNRSILEVMTKEDVKILTGALDQALGSEPDGHVVTWSNPTTGATGTIMPFRTTRTDGRTCRVVETFTQARDRRGTGQWEFCKQGARWALK